MQRNERMTAEALSFLPSSSSIDIIVVEKVKAVIIVPSAACCHCPQFYCHNVREVMLYTVKYIATPFHQTQAHRSSHNNTINSSLSWLCGSNTNAFELVTSCDSVLEFKSLC